MFNRGGFTGQRPMGHNPMNQPSMNLPALNMTGMNMSGMNMSGMSMPGMNMSGMGMAPMNQPNMNLPGMNHPGMNNQHMGHPGMPQQNIGLSGMNQPNMNMNLNRMNQPNMNQPNMNMTRMNQPNMNPIRMNHPDMNQGGGMGFRPEMNNQAFGMRPMDNTGSFGGNTDPMGMKGMPIRSPMHAPPDRLMGPQVMPQRFSSPNVPMHHGQPRMPTQTQEIPSLVNRVLTHSSDSMMMKPKAPLHEPMHVIKKPWDNNPNVYGNVGQDMEMKSVPSGPSLDNVSKPQNRYTNESASSILESFGLSNEDLEELSRYPDDQLTPGNMPSILRDIRLRKLVHPGPSSVPDQPAGRRPASEAMTSKIIDYGHSSKYNYSEPAASVHTYNSPRTEKKPPPLMKQTVTPLIAKPDISPQKGMDNNIPTISRGMNRGRKPIQPAPSRPEKNNIKTLVGEDTTAPKAIVTIPPKEKPVIPIKAAAPVIPAVAPPVQKEFTPAVQVVAAVSQVTYQQPTEKPAAGKGTWVPNLSQEETKKMKKLPTPSMMNDYYAASPRIFPHICSLCNVECRHLKDWIKHQNTSFHIDRCRNLQQQYPDWNPNVLAVRKEDKKDEPTSKTSKSKSPSPRRSRRSGSLHRGRKSRSRSPRSSGRRSRSRSPRRPRHSPRRSRSPRRGVRSPRRSHSPRRHRRSNSPDKKAVDAAVQSFIEASKLKSGEKAKPAKASSNGKKPPPKPSNDKSKKPASGAPAPKKPAASASKPGSKTNSSSSSAKPGNSARPAASSSSARRPSYSSAASKRPTPGSSNIKKPFVSTAAKKTTTSNSFKKKPQPSKPSAPKTTPAISPSNPIHKYVSKPNSGTVIHVTNLPDSGYTDQDILKVVQPFGKVCGILVVQSKNEAFMETNFKEAAAAAVKYSESVPIKINDKRITLSMLNPKKYLENMAEKAAEVKPVEAPAEKATPPVKEEPEKKQPEKPEPDDDLEIPPGFIKRHMLEDPNLKEAEKCVVLISNLPDTLYFVNEITKLAKPFGGVNDILILSSHKKAYLELTSRNSVDSMLKFYSVFPTYLGGNLLSMSIMTRFKDLKNEDLIFVDLIEQSNYKISPSIYKRFVYLTHLPEKTVPNFEVIRMGLRFGKVEKYVIFSNKRKAIVLLHTPSAAKAMHSFLTQYPCSIGDTVIKCSLPSQTALAKNEYVTYIEEDKPSVDIVIDDKPEEAESKEPTEAESKEPTEAEEKLSMTDDKKSEDDLASLSEVSETEMELDLDEVEETPAPPPPAEEEVTSDITPADNPDEPTPTPCDAVLETTPCDAVLETTPCDAVLETTPCDAVLETTPCDAVLETTPCDAVLETTPCDAVLETTPCDAVLETIPCDTVLETIPCDAVLETTPSDAVLETTPCDAVLETTPCDIVLATEDDGEDDDKDDDNDNDDQDDDDEEDDEEEAAEAPEAPDSCAVYIQEEPEKLHQPEQSVSNPQVSEEFDVLVSVESDEEEAELEHIPVCTEKDMEIFDNEDASDSPEAEGSGDVGNKNTKHSSSGSSKVEATNLNLAGKVQEKNMKESKLKTEGSRSGKEKPGEEKTSKRRTEMEGPESDRSMVRTTKYNARKGEISVTVTLESQKQTPKTVDSRKKTSRERGTSSYESSSTQRSNSNRSSPANSASSHTKSGSSMPQKKSSSSGKHVTSQPERDSKDRARSREREARSSSRKDDRTRGSTSSRYPRSSKSNNRSPRSKEDKAESFPFNLDEFVTVDEIVEEAVEPKAKEQKEEEKPDTARKGKRKENDSAPSTTKKSRVMSGDSHELSFVTLDEVGDEEESAGVQDSVVKQSAESMVTVDEEHAEDGPPASAKDKQTLMTLDEISDEDEAQDPSTEQHSSSTVPKTLKKDQLPTLDKILEEDEGQTTPTKSAAVEEPKPVKETKEAASIKVSEKKQPNAKQDAPATERSRKQPLSTVHKGKAEEEMSFADIEHQFLTVDEIGEEEEESANKSQKGPKANKGQSAETSKAPEPTPPAKRGRPRKRPLPQSAEANTDSVQQADVPDTGKGATPGKPPAKGSKQKAADGVKSDASATPTKPETADTPAKKTKPDSAAAEKQTLAPYNSSTAVGLEFLIPKTGYFCELCSLFYMDDSSKLKHCKSLRHYQAVEKHLKTAKPAPEGKSSST
ncbi:zinc finger protein 638 isoform X2 [Anomaloglossus baeobatrachus]